MSEIEGLPQIIAAFTGVLIGLVSTQILWPSTQRRSECIPEFLWTTALTSWGMGCLFGGMVQLAVDPRPVVALMLGVGLAFTALGIHALRRARRLMTEQRVHIVNAFTDSPDGGNPAGVCLPGSDLPPGEMQRIAAEVNLSETAFLRPEGEDWCIRWFTPTIEVPLCGHATLASAHTLWELERVSPDQTIAFQSASGPLTARRDGDWIELDFPADPPRSTEAPAGLVEALGTAPLSVSRAGVGYLVELESAEKVRCLAPDIRAIERTVGSVCITAASDAPEFDFVSRFFAPEHGIDEDPVTGAAHCALAPHWAARLGKTEMMGLQASARGGTVRVRLRGDRVLLGGKALTM